VCLRDTFSMRVDPNTGSDDRLREIVDEEGGGCQMEDSAIMQWRDAEALDRRCKRLAMVNAPHQRLQVRHGSLVSISV
jgi:hypothetical protein